MSIFGRRPPCREFLAVHSAGEGRRLVQGRASLQGGRCAAQPGDLATLHTQSERRHSATVHIFPSAVNRQSQDICVASANTYEGFLGIAIRAATAPVYGFRSARFEFRSARAIIRHGSSSSRGPHADNGFRCTRHWCPAAKRARHNETKTRRRVMLTTGCSRAANSHIVFA